MVQHLIYQIRNKRGKVLAEFNDLLRTRVAAVSMKDGTQIIERSFIDGEWEDVVLYERIGANDDQN